MTKITVFGIIDTNTGLLWNQTHKKFGPLAQNTLFLKDKGQYNRLTRPTTCGYKKRLACLGKNLAPIEIEITIKD